MGMIGTFDGFTTARLGIYAAQHGLRVTGNNISNLNTVGYTRQRVEQVSLKTGGNDDGCKAAASMRRHAAELMEPYWVDDGFAFAGVKG